LIKTVAIVTTPQRDRVVAVAYSGGRDSTALLHATAMAARDIAVRGEKRVEVLALHVHHGLSPHADAWLAHAEQTCLQWAGEGLPVRLMARRVNLRPQPGDSVEALARRARYEALADMALEAGASLVLLAHHQRDQAETLLLQALRGAGVHGLAAMPAQALRDGVVWARPWLRQPREAVEAYVAQHGLSHIEDDSNAHARFARNRLRLDVWPALIQAFPQAEASLAASARRVQDVLPSVQAWREALLRDLRVPGTANSGHGSLSKCGLDAAKWAELSGPERRETLLHWYREAFGRALPATWIERLAHEVPGLVFHQRATYWRPVGLGLYRGVLAPVPSRRSTKQGACLRGVHAEAGMPLSILAPGDQAVPCWPGILRVTEAEQGGVAPALLARLTARPRQGGEQFQAGAGRPPRSLKKQFQAMGIPAWCREGPFLWCDEQLVFVPGLGLDARCLAPQGSPQWKLDWLPPLP
jgi:tRNA(Ile)-lysidine synthase